MSLSQIWQQSIAIAASAEQIKDVCLPHVLFSARLSRLLANYISEPTGLNLNKIKEAALFLSDRLYFFKSIYTEATEYILHIFGCLQYAISNFDDVNAMIQETKVPSTPSHKQMIQESLQSFANSFDTTKQQVKAAILASWFFRMRQQVGSCFSTALAIHIQAEQPLNFIKGLVELVSTGKLVRVVDGHEFFVPLIPESGLGSINNVISNSSSTMSRILTSPLFSDLFLSVNANYHAEYSKIVADQSRLQSVLAQLSALGANISIRLLLETIVKIMFPNQKELEGLITRAFISLADIALLRTWDYTLASFSDSSGSLTQKIVYIALGWNSSQKEGVGKVLQQTISALFDAQDKKLKELRDVYHSMQSAADASAAMMRSASSYENMKSASRSYSARTMSMSSIESEFQQERNKSECLSDLFNHLTDEVLVSLPSHFAEIYHVPNDTYTLSSIIADSPARFRLVSKQNTSRGEWKKIQTPKEFINSISEFFRSIETDVIDRINNKFSTNVSDEISECFQSITQHMYGRTFIEYAFLRIAHNYEVKIPIDVTNKIEWLSAQGIAPWSLPSGGSPNILLSSYYFQSSPPPSVSTEILFPIDVFKLSVLAAKKYKQSDFFLQEDINRLGYMIAASPNHVFRTMVNHFLDIQKLPIESIDMPIQTYMDSIIDSMRFPLFNDDQVLEIIDVIQQEFHLRIKTIPKGSLLINVVDNLKQVISQEFDVAHAKYVVESAVLQCLPFVDTSSGTWILNNIIQPLCTKHKIDFATWKNAFAYTLQSFSRAHIGSHKMMYAIMDACPVLCSNKDLLGDLCTIMRNAKMLINPPMIFGDLNWDLDYIGLGVSPWTYNPELWICFRHGLKPKPLTLWDKFFTDSENSKDWLVYYAKKPYSLLQIGKSKIRNMIIYNDKGDMKKLIE